ncbi:AI-2E family transporter [Zwartia sp.]|uniref:AI-2E family transporter n=1 Tax=Zwartia sp. TaxID=2978004 RepID=UPI003BAF178E
MKKSDSTRDRLTETSSKAEFGSQLGLTNLALLSLTILALLLCYFIAKPFIASLAWAAAFAILGWPLHRKICHWVPYSTLAATLSCTVIALVVIIPSAVVIPGAIEEAFNGYKLIRAQIESGAWDQAFANHVWIATTWDWLRQRLDIGDVLQRAGSALTTLSTFAVKASVARIVEFLMTFLFLFYFLRDRDTLLVSIRGLLPMTPTETGRVFGVVSDTIYATVYGKVLVGIVQGVLGGAMFWWLDIPAAWFWAVVMGLMSIIPLLGPPIVWGPAALLLMLNGELGEGVLLLAWGVTIVGLADNFLYPIVVGKYLRLHTVPLLIALIGGVLVFGAMGLFLGPVILALAFVSLQIWRDRSHELKK